MINVHLMAHVEKPFSLVRESLAIRRRLHYAFGETVPLRTIAQHFKFYYQDGHPPPVTRWLPSIVEHDLRDMLKEHREASKPPTSLPLIHHLKRPF